MYLFLALIGQWILDPLVPDSLSTGKRIIWVVYITDNVTGLFTSYLLELSSAMNVSYFLERKPYIFFKWTLYLLDVITTRSILPMELFILDLLHTSHVNKTVSSSDVAIIDVCIYSGIRFAPIYVPNYASSVRITIFFL